MRIINYFANDVGICNNSDVFILFSNIMKYMLFI